MRNARRSCLWDINPEQTWPFWARVSSKAIVSNALMTPGSISLHARRLISAYLAASSSTWSSPRVSISNPPHSRTRFLALFAHTGDTRCNPTLCLTHTTRNYTFFLYRTRQTVYRRKRLMADTLDIACGKHVDLSRLK